MAAPVGGHALNRFARWVLQRLGWTLLRPELPGPKGVIVAYPHTSNWDFPVAMLAKWGLGWELRFWAKDSLFQWPLFGSWLRWLGGVPVQRSSPQGLVSDTLEQIRQADVFWLALAPEGSRRRGDGWRMGFYHVWAQAELPLGVAVIDWQHKVVGVKAFVHSMGDEQADFDQIRACIGEAGGHTPTNAADITPWRRTQAPADAPASTEMNG